MKSDNKTFVVSNPWEQLKKFTTARIALGRAGVSLPTKPHLEFQLAHARARNAVQLEIDVDKLVAELNERDLVTVTAQSAAHSRTIYLQRPDKGRILDDVSRNKITKMSHPGDGYNVVFVIGDGLSSMAIEQNAVALLDALWPALHDNNWSVGPIVVVKGARVAIGDEIGAILGAQIVVVLIGERPGLSSPDSLGVYMTHNPRIGLTDESRNCISNIRREGLPYDIAAYKLLYLMNEARHRGLSGVNLKDKSDEQPTATLTKRKNFLFGTK